MTESYCEIATALKKAAEMMEEGSWTTGSLGRTEYPNTHCLVGWIGKAAYGNPHHWGNIMPRKWENVFRDAGVVPHGREVYKWNDGQADYGGFSGKASVLAGLKKAADHACGLARAEAEAKAAAEDLATERVIATGF